MGSKEKWTDERCLEVLKWKEENNASYLECGKHFGSTGSAISQGVMKFRQRGGAKIVRRGKYNKKPKGDNLPVAVKPPRAHRIIELDIPETPTLRAVPVAMVPMQHLQAFLAAVCQ